MGTGGRQIRGVSLVSLRTILYQSEREHNEREPLQSTVQQCCEFIGHLSR